MISQSVCEEMFNTIKHDVASSSNTRCTPQRAMTIAIDTGVLSKLNKYDEVQRDTETIERAFTFNKEALQPRMNVKKIAMRHARRTLNVS